MVLKNKGSDVSDQSGLPPPAGGEMEVGGSGELLSNRGEEVHEPEGSPDVKGGKNGKRASLRVNPSERISLQHPDFKRVDSSDLDNFSSQNGPANGSHALGGGGRRNSSSIGSSSPSPNPTFRPAGMPPSSPSDFGSVPSFPSQTPSSAAVGPLPPLPSGLFHPTSLPHLRLLALTLLNKTCPSLPPATIPRWHSTLMYAALLCSSRLQTTSAAGNDPLTYVHFKRVPGSR